jgi:hypothetical protein
MQARWLLAASAALAVAGCASTQLNYNTVDLAASIDSVYRRQVLNNIAKLIDDRWAIPSYLEIASGVVQTSNSVSPSATFPLSDTLARNGVGLLTASTRAGAGMTVSASDGWTQNWVIAPVTDANTLRLIRAIYRYVIFGLVDPHYHFAVASLYKNPVTGWMFWRGGSSPSRLPPEGVPTVSLGDYGGYELIVTAEAYEKGYVQDLILAVMAANDVAVPPSTGKGGGKKAGAAAPATKRNRFQLIVPNQVIPAQ